jgi:hypothetical protein
LVLPLQFGYASLLGDVFQLTLGHLKFRLEAESVKFPVGHGGVVVRLRGVVWQRLIGRRGRRVPLNKPETNRIVRNKGKSQTSNEEKMAIIASDANWRGSLPPRRRRGACCCSPPLVLGDALVIGKKSLRLAKILRLKAW